MTNSRNCTGQQSSVNRLDQCNISVEQVLWSTIALNDLFHSNFSADSSDESQRQNIYIYIYMCMFHE